MAIEVKPKEQRVQIDTLLSHRTKEGMVQIIWGREKSQLDPATARQLGMQLIEAAEAAETDEGMWRFAKDHLELGDTGAAQLIGSFRAFRQEVMEKNIKAAVPAEYQTKEGEA